MVSPSSDHKTNSPACTTIGCDRPGTVVGTLVDHDETFHGVTYCPECAGFLYQQFEPTGQVDESAEDDQYWTVTVEIPVAATNADVDRIFEAVADAAWEAQPNERTWDVFVHGYGPKPDDYPHLARD